MVNSFEFQAREIKKDKIIRAIYRTFRPSNGYEAGALAATLSATTQADRNAFAVVAGVGTGKVSETTWKQIVAEIAAY